jgi:hypothetical protein
MRLADPGDAVLIPSPYYAAFEFDLAARAGCVIVPTYGSPGILLPLCIVLGRRVRTSVVPDRPAS